MKVIRLIWHSGGTNDFLGSSFLLICKFVFEKKMEDYGFSMKIHHFSKIWKLKKKYRVEHNCHKAQPTFNLEVLVWIHLCW
jgi:hypothetical protein